MKFANDTTELGQLPQDLNDKELLMKSGTPIRLLQDYASDDETSDINNNNADANVLTLIPEEAPATGFSVAQKRNVSLETDIGSKSVTEQEGERKTTSKLLEPKSIREVDEFGRYRREGPADSDSDDDSRYSRTGRINRRDRSSSHSRSPRRRISRRRSPRRRRGRRSRSRSWSPRRCRSRSKSPILRRSGDFGGVNVKRDNSQQCFDFSRGRCYRGASCRYIHHETNRNSSSRRFTNKHDLEVHSHEKNLGINEGLKNIYSNVSDYEHDGVRSQDVNLCQNVTVQEVEHRKEDSVRNAVVGTTTSGLNSQLVNNDPNKIEKNFRQASPDVQETLVARDEHKTLVHDNGSYQKAVNSHQPYLVDGFQPEALSDVGALKPTGGTYEDVIPSGDGSFVPQIQSNVSVGIPEHSAQSTQHISVSFVSDSSFDKKPMTYATASTVSSSEPVQYILSSTQQQSAPSSVSLRLSSEQPSLHSQAYKEIQSHSSSSAEFRMLPPPPTLPLPPPPPLPLPRPPPPPPVVSDSHGENIMHIPQIPREYGVMQQNAFFPFQFATRGKFEHYPAPLHTQNFQFQLPPNRTSLPPPPPPLAVTNSSFTSGVAEPYMSVEFNQNQLHSTNFVSQTSVRHCFPSHSQSSGFEDQAYTSMQDHSRTFMPRAASSQKHLPQGNPASQPLSGSNLNRNDPYKQLSMQDSSSQQQQSIYNFPYSASEINLSAPAENLAVSRFPPDALDSNHSTSLPAFGGSQISAHYNPYASTFEQPPSSKFMSSISRQENDIIHNNDYGSYVLNHTPIIREGVDTGSGSRKSVSSPKSARVDGQLLPKPGSNLYDPLFDCIEASSSSLKKLNRDQKQEVTGESNISPRPKSSSMSLDTEEKNKHEDVGAVASTSSQSNDEYGESADAEVGAVENESLSNHVDVANMSPGDDEINQVKSPGKRKKSSDSRSMKLFKISIANFVKEVLKPSWRQGNMSKVAFKTIVKKTVDKVSGAMKGHRVPKSQAKISQYIDSSQRKLTKLVMGYVDKYVKM
ncbi:hypothetical protein Lal_00012336 [Lupinus albus]|uniref:Putative transcription factor C3H family n=1 Tax=Lupinus albus TaxID=3870 RepID=A0A6A4QM44_LUPAL|nr:putative transcription factor C3H family [Lupinus albus]KAF1872115.1 hypothetical protein Lal_00012336 [Lupinus albus]